MPYTDLDKRLGLKLRDHLKIARSPARMDGDGQPVAMDYIHAAHELLEELRRLGWHEPPPAVGSLDGSIPQPDPTKRFFEPK